MAVPRSHWFNPNLDPELLSSMEAAAGKYKPYRVELRSGYRPGDPRQHGRGEALDVQLYDPKTGSALDSYQKGGAISPYQQFANSWYQGLTPEQQQKARWGGYFGDPNAADYATKYGNQDYMHFDFGRTPELGMAAGDWQTGFNPAAQKALGLSSGGGIGQQVAAMQAAGYSPEQIKAALLTTIAGTEAPGYNTLYGGGTFDDYSQHPNRQIPIMSGPNKGDYSTAAGRYQMLHGTWENEAKKLGLKDFSAASQDTAAWDLAESTYKAATGGSLQDALASGDPARINAAAKILSSQWTSMPGGIEQAGKYGTQTFADVFGKNLSGGALGTAAAGGAGAGAGGQGASAAAAPAASAAAGKGNLWSTLGQGLGAMASGGAERGPQMGTTAQPAAAMVADPAQPFVDPQQQEMQRQQLAQAMARLNTGKLWG